MRLRCFAPSLLVLLSVLAQAQDSNVPPPQGRITATVLNDEDEPLKGASVCIHLSSPSEESTVCGSLTDQNGKVQIEKVRMGKVGVDAEVLLGGYWSGATKVPRMRTVTLTPEKPFGHVTLRIGPRPGVVNLSLRDKETGEFVRSAAIRLIGPRGEMAGSGTGNFERTEPSELRVPIPASTDMILEVTAPGYKNWVYTDAASPSQATLRLESGEQRSISVEMEQQAKAVAPAH